MPLPHVISNSVFKTTKNTKQVSANFTRPANTTQYAANDAVSNSASAPSVITFTDVAREYGGSGKIVAANLISSANQSTKGSFDLLLFSTAPTPTNDNAALALTDAELETCIGAVSWADSTAVVGDAASGASGNCAYFKNALDIKFDTPTTHGNIFGLLVARSTYTPVSGEKFTVILQVEQD